MKNIFILIIIVVFNSSISFAQKEIDIKENTDHKSKPINPNSTQTVNDKIEIKNSKGASIITITDEGSNAGSITIPQSSPGTTSNKLYNEGGTLKFDGTIVGNGGADSINQLGDAKYDGSSLFIGYQAGNNDDATVNHNTGVGRRTLYSNTTGAYNTSSGELALYSNVEGNYNVAIGSEALISNTEGNSNTAIGTLALNANTTGNENIGIGLFANRFNQQGSKNTIIGHYAGHGTNNHNKSGNVFLGYHAGYHEFGDNKLYINNDSSSAPLIWGDFAVDSLRINGNIHVTGNITTDGNTIAVTSIDDLTDGKFDGSSLFLGLNAGNSDDGTSNSNTALGYNSLASNTSGIDNTALGYEVLKMNSTGQRNSAIGKWALYSNTTGGQNTANGFESLYSNTTGFFNTAIGMSSLFTNTEGFSNTAIGRSSLQLNTLGGQNSALGVSALFNNTTGSYNVGIGFESNSNNQEGSKNTIIGYQAGKGTNNHSKSGNIFIGHKAGFFETGNNKLYIQNDSSSTPLIWGDFSDGAEEVKINGNFHVTGNITSDGSIGAVEINDLSDARTDGSSIFLGSNSGFIDDGLNFNTGLGVYSLHTNTSGTLNTGIGVSSLRSNTIGSYNVALGNSSNYYNQSGSRNTIIGYEAGRGTSLHNKSGNIFIGHKAGYYETGNDKLYIQNDSSSSPLIWGNFADGNKKVKINGDFETTGDIFSSANLVAIGENSEIGGNNSFAFGYYSNSSGGSSYAMGNFALASATSAYAFGNGAKATGASSHAYGSNAQANGDFSTAIGSNVFADGDYSKAIGTNAKITANGSMFLADNSTSTVHTTVIDNIFNARFANGYKLFTNSNLSVGAQMLAGANSWTVISDSTKKENFRVVNADEVLSKISKFNLRSWNYKGQDPTKFRHYGPMAQEFYNAFGNDGIGTVGNDTTIASADFDGINLIAIQALERRTNVQNDLINEMMKEIKQLKIRNSQLEQVNNDLKSSYDELNKKISNYSTIENRLNKLETLLSKQSDQNSSLTFNN